MDIFVQSDYLSRKNKFIFYKHEMAQLKKTIRSWYENLYKL
jgi:hypothetical protein